MRKYSRDHCEFKHSSRVINAKEETTSFIPLFPGHAYQCHDLDVKSGEVYLLHSRWYLHTRHGYLLSVDYTLQVLREKSVHGKEEKPPRYAPHVQ